MQFWVALWVALLLARRGFGSIFVRLGARFLFWSLVPWELSLLPVLRPGVPLAPWVALLVGFWPLWGCPAFGSSALPVLWSLGPLLAFGCFCSLGLLPVAAELSAQNSTKNLNLTNALQALCGLLVPHFILFGCG